ncbi:MAG TPA: response regulator [Macromonas sp.]|nr:response regulator [Macromonas sp.]
MRHHVDLRDATGLVIDGNITSRSILVSQLRELGLRSVGQSPRIGDARRQLEFKTFDIVVCEQNFPNDNATGQDLLDDLRRCGLLPFGTIFIMVTAEAAYSKVAEAAESALDSYLLRPYTAARLEERIFQARRRKQSLKGIFEAIEAQDFELGAKLCIERFESKGEYWLYAARVGAELLLRTDQFDAAQQFYQAVIEAKTLPWAKLGVARAQLEAGQVQQAVATLDGLINAESNYADAYDVMGRALLEQGNFPAALDSYKMATDMTPASISRLQRHGMLAHYCGDQKTAEDMLSRAVRLGLDSKMFDAQTLVLLAFMRVEADDRKGVQRCYDDIINFQERFSSSTRVQRLARVLEALQQLMQHQTARALELVRGLVRELPQDDFDFEAACNMLTVVSLLAERAIQIDEVMDFVEKLSLRFGTSKALTELLARSAEAYPPYAEKINEAHTIILKRMEQAVRLGLDGNPTGAVQGLLELAHRTQNTKVIESAWGMLNRYKDRIENADTLRDEVQALRVRYTSYANRVAIGDKALRQAGGVSLRVMDVKSDDTVSGGKPESIFGAA